MTRNRISNPDESGQVYTGTLRADGVVRKDVMDSAKRSALMGRIRGKGTGPERRLHQLLLANGWEPELHVRALPGKPDFVFPTRQVAVFVDGDFWHGWRFPQWERKLTPAWREKIATTRARDRRNHARLRRSGWTVVRVWEHQLARAPENCIDRIARALRANDGLASADQCAWPSKSGSVTLQG